MMKYQPTEELCAKHFGKVEIFHLLLERLVHFGCFGHLTLFRDGQFTSLHKYAETLAKVHRAMLGKNKKKATALRKW